MFSRKQAQEKALQFYTEQMYKFGGNAVGLVINSTSNNNKIRQNHWSFNEIIKSIKADTNLPYGPNVVSEFLESLNLNEKKKQLKEKFSSCN